MTATSLTPAATSRQSQGLSGTLSIPGDKSISHRSLIIGSQVLGTSTVHNILESEDVTRTADALRRAGVTIHRKGGVWEIQGIGIGGLQQPEDVLDMGNSGTSTRLLAGLFASYPYSCLFTGDASLRKRPMQRIATPLSEIGAQFMARPGMMLPMAMQGADNPIPIAYRLPVASAQVKSAIMLAGLNIPGNTTVIEPVATRDHTERMFRAVGFPVAVEPQEDGTHITVTGQPKLTHEDREFHVPSDPSSAAFLAVAALITKDSELVLENICINDTRIGLYHSLKEMGAEIDFRNEREVQGEPVADLHIRSTGLKAITVPAERAPSMIDEYPILAVAAACAEGISEFKGLGELRVKESDRFAAIVDGLTACGIRVDVDGDDMAIHGQPTIPGGATIASRLDHRIAMSFLVLGLASEAPIAVDDVQAINTSFPGFIRLLNSAGAHINTTGGRTLPLPLRRKSDRQLVIAIDGPAASGKGTLARLLADYFHIAHLDTGGLYRATALKLLSQGGDPQQESDAINAAQSISVHDLSNPRLREEQVGNIASKVSTIPDVRQALLEFQRSFAHQEGGAVLDGRDIGTVVCPDARFKVFMNASIEARAQRRHRQLQKQGIEVIYSSVLKDLIERDKRDTDRKSAPLIPADDAFIIDTTDMTIPEVFDEVVARILRELEGGVEPKQVAGTT